MKKRSEAMQTLNAGCSKVYPQTHRQERLQYTVQLSTQCKKRHARCGWKRETNLRRDDGEFHRYNTAQFMFKQLENRQHFLKHKDIRKFSYFDGDSKRNYHVVHVVAVR